MRDLIDRCDGLWSLLEFEVYCCSNFRQSCLGHYQNIIKLILLALFHWASIFKRIVCLLCVRIVIRWINSLCHTRPTQVYGCQVLIRRSFGILSIPRSWAEHSHAAKEENIRNFSLRQKPLPTGNSEQRTVREALMTRPYRLGCLPHYCPYSRNFPLAIPQSLVSHSPTASRPGVCGRCARCYCAAGPNAKELNTFTADMTNTCGEPGPWRPASR